MQNHLAEAVNSRPTDSNRETLDEDYWKLGVVEGKVQGRVVARLRKYRKDVPRWNPAYRTNEYYVDAAAS